MCRCRRFQAAKRQGEAGHTIVAIHICASMQIETPLFRTSHKNGAHVWLSLRI